MITNDVKATIAGVVAGVPGAIYCVSEAFKAGRFSGMHGALLLLCIAIVGLGYICNKQDVTGDVKFGLPPLIEKKSILSVNQIKNDVMTLKSVITGLEDKVSIVIGKGLNFLDGHVTQVIALEQDLLNALNNPAVEFAIASVLPSQVTQMEPRIEGFLQAAIADETLGMTIEAEVKAAPTTEAKIQVLIQFVQTTGMNKNRIVSNICAAILKGLNNAALKDEVYAMYLNAKKIIG